MSTKTTVQDVVPFALERQVCFALAVTNRAELAVYRPLKPLGLTTRNLDSRKPVGTGGG